MKRCSLARMRLPAVTAGAVLAGAAMLTASTPAAAGGVTPSSVGSSAWADFDGDGIGDLAIGMPQARIGSASHAGGVIVVYGSSGGLDPVRHQEFDQNTNGILGKAEKDDNFGQSLAAGDIDGDGYSDLVVGIPGEDTKVNGHHVHDEGAIQVIFGGPTGLTTRNRVYYPKYSNVDMTEWGFGWSLVALDAYNGNSPGHDGKADIGVGIRGAAQFRGGYAIVSSARLVPGGTGPVKIVRGGMPHGFELGVTIAAGDFDADGTDDLVVGAPEAPAPDPAHPGQYIDAAGQIEIVYGAGSHPKRFLSEGSNGVPGTPGDHDLFGLALAVAHDPTVNAYDSLWVGAPTHATGGLTRSGIVYRFDSKDDGSGINPAGTTLHQGTAKFSDANEVGDLFGDAIAVADFGRGAGLDVVVGVPGQAVGSKYSAGAVMVSYSDGTNDVITQDKAGYAGTSTIGDEYGTSLYAANFGNGGTPDLAVGAFYQTVSGTKGAGQVHVLYGSATTGFTSSNDRTLDLGDGLGPGVQPAEFGFALR